MSADPSDAGLPTTIRDAGHDELWLQDLLAERPALMGIGEVEIIGQETHSLDGGNLDIFAADEDTYYSIEVQLGEVDVSHSFRVFDYWARQRAVYTDKAHVAVLIVESATGRFRPALQALAEYLPLIVVELKARMVGADLVLIPRVVIANAGLDMAVVPAASAYIDRTADDWRADSDPEAWAAYEALLEYVKGLGAVRPEYRQRTYISLRRGRRAWAAVELGVGAITLHLVDPDGHLGRGDPSQAYKMLAAEAAAAGIPLSWTAGRNAGKQPVVVRLRAENLAEGVIRELIAASWRWLDREGGAFSDEFGPGAFFDRDPFGYDDSEQAYSLESIEVGYPGRSLMQLLHWGTDGEPRALWTFEPDDWDPQELARRVLLHATGSKPTRKLIRLFERKLIGDLDLGLGWNLRAEELAAYMHEWG